MLDLITLPSGREIEPIELPSGQLLGEHAAGVLDTEFDLSPQEAIAIVRTAKGLEDLFMELRQLQQEGNLDERKEAVRAERDRDAAARRGGGADGEAARPDAAGDAGDGATPASAAGPSGASDTGAGDGGGGGDPGDDPASTGHPVSAGVGAGAGDVGSDGGDGGAAAAEPSADASQPGLHRSLGDPDSAAALREDGDGAGDGVPERDQPG